MRPHTGQTLLALRSALLSVPLGVLLFITACATAPPLQAGLSETEVAARLGTPTGRYALKDGRTRLEFARGPYGRTTVMVDLDSAGRSQQWAQVLDDAHFAQVVDGLPRDDLLRLLGRPAHRAREWQNRETWYWRYQTNDCLWFAVTLSAEGSVMNGGGHLPDPACDAPSDRARR